jgi:Uma2 family endonuclease
MAAARAQQITLPAHDAAVEKRPQTRLFDVDEYYRMAEVGILKPDERVELIEGEIVVMNPIGDRHALTVDQLNVPLVQRFGGRARIGVQNPIRLGRKVEPQPDLTVSRLDALRPRRYQGKHPRPEDVLLVIEVADTSVAYDLGEKAVLYARYGVPELWVFDLPGYRLVIHREPTATGYANVRELPRGASISPLAFPDVTFTADELLGEAVAEVTDTEDEAHTHAEAAGDQ